MFSSVDFVVLLHSQRYSCLCCKLFENIRMPWVFARVFSLSFVCVCAILSNFVRRRRFSRFFFNLRFYFSIHSHTLNDDLFSFRFVICNFRSRFEERKKIVENQIKSLWIFSVVLLLLLFRLRIVLGIRLSDSIVYCLGVFVFDFCAQFFSIIINWTFHGNRISRCFAFWLHTLLASIQFSYCFECPQIPVQIYKRPCFCELKLFKISKYSIKFEALCQHQLKIMHFLCRKTIFSFIIIWFQIS